MSYTAGLFYIDFEGGSDTARTALTNVIASNPSGSITRMNKTGHGLVTGAVVDTTLYTAWLNGAWKITVVDADNFDLDGAVWQATADADGTVTPRGGSSKADAWKTFLTGASAARIQAGDTMRVMASLPYKSLGVTGAFTEDSKTVTLSGALTADITRCESAWTASANVTSTADAARKEGSFSAKHVIAAGFTTGLASFFATGTLDLSAYQQVSFQILCTGAVAANTLSLRLCSDVAGVTTVNTIAVPAFAANIWTPFTVNTGGALGSAIQSVALYCDLDPGAVTVQIDNIIAVKAASSDDALSLTSLIAKVNCTYWTPSTTYSVGNIRQPTPPNRTGFCYRVSAVGSPNISSGSEPDWPEEIGATVTDGDIEWTCHELEDSWFTIQSINGTTVLLDSFINSDANEGKGYPGETETVALYRREPINDAISSGVHQTVSEAGTSESYMTYTGGWDRTNMTVQDGETWVSGQNGTGTAYLSAGAFTKFENLNAARFGMGMNITGAYAQVRNCRFACCGQSMSLSTHAEIIGAYAWGGASSLPDGAMNLGMWARLRRATAAGNLGNSVTVGSGIFGNRAGIYYDNVNVFSNFGTAVRGVEAAVMNRVHTRNNNSSLGMFQSDAGSWVKARDSKFEESTILANSGTTGFEQGIGNLMLLSQDDNQVAGAIKVSVLEDGSPYTVSLIESATDQRSVAEGYSLKFQPRSLNRVKENPLDHPIARRAVFGGALVTATLQVRRDDTDIKGVFYIPGGQIAGIPNDIEVACEPSINTWQEFELNCVPEEDGVIEFRFKCWNKVDITSNMWIHVFEAVQA